MSRDLVALLRAATLRWTRRPGWVVAALALALLSGCGAGPRPTPSQSADPWAAIADPRAEIRSLFAIVSDATASRFGITDDRGRWMDTLKVIEIPEAPTFGAVYHTWDEGDQTFRTNVASSPDLLTWTWRAELGRMASQPTIARNVDGGYVVAWEQEPDPIHIVIESFASWADLVAGTVERRFEVPITMPACGEGTASIDYASNDRVDLGFHYHADCVRDLQASGWTDWTAWHSRQERARDAWLFGLGVQGHVGDRDGITIGGDELVLLEGQRVVDDNRSWRIHLLDETAGSAEQLEIGTPARSEAFSNPTISKVTIGGRPALVATLYVGSEGARGGEDGPLLFYRVR